MLRFHLDLVAGPQSQHESPLGKVVHRCRSHCDGRGATYKYARNTGAQQNILGPESAGGQNRELIAPMPLGHPRRFIAQFIGKLNTIHDVRRVETAGERKPDPFH